MASPRNTLPNRLSLWYTRNRTPRDHEEAEEDEEEEEPEEEEEAAEAEAEAAAGTTEEEVEGAAAAGVAAGRDPFEAAATRVENETESLADSEMLPAFVLTAAAAAAAAAAVVVVVVVDCSAPPSVVAAVSAGAGGTASVNFWLQMGWHDCFCTLLLNFLWFHTAVRLT